MAMPPPEVGGGKVAVPSLSTLLDLRLPVVELEADRLHAAVSWLYKTVQKLQQQSAETDGSVKRLQEQLESAERAAERAVASPVKPGADGSQELIEQRLQQMEQRRLGDHALLETRLEVLRRQMDARPSTADMQAAQDRSARCLQEAAQSSREELAALGRMLQADLSAQQLQLQEDLHALRCQVAQLAQTEQPERPQATVTAGYQELPRQREPEVTEPVPERHSGLADMHLALASRVEILEQSMKNRAPSLSPTPTTPTMPMPPSPKGQETDGIMQRFTDLDKVHLSTLQRIGEVENRMARLEVSIPTVRPQKQVQTSAWEAPVNQLQTSHASLAEDLQASVSQVSTLRSSLSTLLRYISGEQPEEDATAVPNKLEWLERRISQLVANRKGLTLEGRLQQLEAMGSPEIANRVHRLETVLGKLDVDAVREVPPQLTIVKEDQETFKQDLRREVQELKVLVGCMEACVPKETRKAIQLFKRGAGMPDEELISPESLKLQTDVISWREELQQQLTESETNAAQRWDGLNAQLVELEMKQEKVELLLKRKPTPEGDAGFVAPQGWTKGE
ncbi:unnamed protein product [Effrenium voratum]|uniref:Uncharacterized protein n=1 Tax=Effrenium voratum TaxID=2562239 RepID=A0AA36I921_9DINO|nr:unnamed protein product [Effrenium voratum]